MEEYLDIMDEFAGEFGEEPVEGDGQRFAIDSDAKAEWAIRKIAEEEAECDRLTACCQIEIDRYKERQDAYVKRLECRTANLKALLQEYFSTVPVKETKTQQKYELPSGSLVMKKASSDFKADSDKLRSWLTRSGMPDYLKVEVSPKWAMVKKQLSVAENGDIIFGETGEIVPADCVTIEEKPSKFEVMTK